jgi:signal transduction histidine kinase
VSPKGGSPLLSIILISPLFQSDLVCEDQQYLIDTSIPGSHSSKVRLIAEQQQELDKVRSNASEAQPLTEQSQKDRENTASNIELLQMQFEQERTRAASLAAMVTGLEAKTAELEAKASPNNSSEIVAQLKDELHLALTELAALKAELAGREQFSPPVREMVAGNNGARERSEVLASIAQELRRPVSSIIGYTDLLLQSVGLWEPCSASSSKEVKASTERMGGLLDELINATTLEIGGKDLHPTAVDLNAVIDEALAAIIANLSERNIALRVDLPDDIPQLNADRDALLQILTNLLQNAGMVTPVDGEIWLRTRAVGERAGLRSCAVTDSGGGIPPSR